MEVKSTFGAYTKMRNWLKTRGIGQTEKLQECHKDTALLRSMTYSEYAWAKTPEEVKEALCRYSVYGPQITRHGERCLPDKAGDKMKIVRIKEVELDLNKEIVSLMIPYADKCDSKVSTFTIKKGDCVYTVEVLVRRDKHARAEYTVDGC